MLGPYKSRYRYRNLFLFFIDLYGKENPTGSAKLIANFFFNSPKIKYIFATLGDTFGEDRYIGIGNILAE